MLEKYCRTEFILYGGTCLNILEKWISNGDNSIFISIWIFDIYEMKWQNWYLVFIRLLFSFYVLINVYLVCWFSSILPLWMQGYLCDGLNVLSIKGDSTWWFYWGTMRDTIWQGGVPDLLVSGDKLDFGWIRCWLSDYNTTRATP
jgi:hypothetical protein